MSFHEIRLASVNPLKKHLIHILSFKNMTESFQIWKITVYMSLKKDIFEQNVREDLERHANISIHHGKTKVWNKGGHEPASCQSLQRAAREVDEEAVVWRGDATLPLEQQDIRAMGTQLAQTRPIFFLHPDFIRATTLTISFSFIGKKSDAHSRLFERIPAVGDIFPCIDRSYELVAF